MEDWDDDAPTTTTKTSNYGVFTDGGRKFTAGRGFKPVHANDDDWGPSEVVSVGEDSGWTNNDFNSGFGGGDRRGRGGRGSRGGR
ncbi:hypothetical protein HHI36_003666, partial [Cryptolaemus montrouzieri]